MIVIIGDTHVKNYDQLPKEMRLAIENAKWVIHTGDYTSIEVLNALINLKASNFIGVYGNTDPLDIRKKVAEEVVVQIEGKKFGITHPSTGGSYKSTIAKVLNQFKDIKLDAIIFGHTHDALIERFENMLLLNPGKGYYESASFNVPSTFIKLRIGENFEAEIVSII